MTKDTPGAALARALPAANDTADRSNQRRSPRRRVLKNGKAIFGRNHSIVDCTIDNQSEGGAHICMTNSHGVPQEFFLAEASRGIIYRVEVAWSTTTGMGLRILGPMVDAAASKALSRKFRRG